MMGFRKSQESIYIRRQQGIRDPAVVDGLETHLTRASFRRPNQIKVEETMKHTANPNDANSTLDEYVNMDDGENDHAILQIKKNKPSDPLNAA